MACEKYIVGENSKEFFEIAKQKKIVLFVGAGINMDLSPQWKKIVSEIIKELPTLSEHSNLTDKVCQKIESDFDDLYVKATLAKTVLKERYARALKSKIYNKYNANKGLLESFCGKALTTYIHNCKTNNQNDYVENYLFGYLAAIARLSQCKQVEAIVTYNYDNFLEKAIQALPRNIIQKDVISIFKQEQHNLYSDKTIPIYHVHGFIPDITIGHDVHFGDIVFAQDEYFNTMADPYSWQSSVQLFFLRNYICLFLGTSLTDWNMLRFLAISLSNNTNHHYCLTPTFDTYYDGLKTTLWHRFGVKPIYINHRNCKLNNKHINKFSPLPCWINNLRYILNKEGN